MTIILLGLAKCHNYIDNPPCYIFVVTQKQNLVFDIKVANRLAVDMLKSV